MKFRIGIVSLSIGLQIATSLAASATPASAPQKEEVPPESQLVAPGTAPLPVFNANGGVVKDEPLEKPMPTSTNAKSGVRTSPEEMTSTFVPSPQAVPAPQPGVWQTFVSKWLDINKPGYLGNLLSVSQQKDLQELDSERQHVDAAITSGTASGALKDPSLAQFKSASVDLAALESKLVKSDALSYQEATDVLFRFNMLKASIEAALHGRSNTVTSDYFDASDPASYRDHLLRKLYYFRLNSHLTDAEYDTFRAHVNHASEHLNEVGTKIDKGEIIAHFKKLDAEISQMADEAPTATTAEHFTKKF